MSNPFWFDLIRKWREMGMGQYGVSFPYLVGAVARQSGEKVTRGYVQSLFQDIIDNPVQGYYCEVRWCGNIDEPVVSVESDNTFPTRAIRESFIGKNDQHSLAFTSNLMSMYTLNCSSKEECLEKLILRALENAEKGLFSKNNGLFGEFMARDIEFIENVAALSTNA